MTEQDARWTPVARGETYCSPACGGGCTRAGFDRATEEATRMCEVLGKGWEPEVWENLGWHFAATKGCARVIPHVEGGTYRRHDYDVTGYHAYFNSEAGQVSGNKQVSPFAALLDVIYKVRDRIAKIDHDLRGVLP